MPTATIFDRIEWVILNSLKNRFISSAILRWLLKTEILAGAIIKEIENTHKIIDPENVTEEMIEASFVALPEHYDPPDPKRKPWHAFKAKRRYTAMVKAAGKISK